MEINLRPLPKQDEAYKRLFDDRTREIVFGGGAGGGKTWLACEWLMMQAIRYPGTRWFIGREELTRLLKSTFITFRKVCKHHGFTDYRFNAQRNYLEFGNGSCIDFLDLKFQPSDPMFERFGSSEYTGGFIEEGGEIHFDAYDTLKTRIGRHLNKEFALFPKLLITCNPKKNWLYRLFYQPWKDGTLPPDRAFIRALHSDNDHLDGNYKANLDNIQNRTQRERLRDGNWDYADDSAALMSFDTINDLFTNPVEPGEEKYLIGDIARFGADRTVAVLWRGSVAYIRKNRIWTKQDTGVTAAKFEQISQEEGVRRSQIAIDEDGVGGGVVDRLPGCKGFLNGSAAIQPPEAKHDDTRRVNFGNLRSQCWFKFAELAKAGLIRVECDDETLKQELIDELSQIKQKNPDKEEARVYVVPKEEIKDAIGRSSDLADPLMMKMIFQLQPSRQPYGVAVL